MDRSKQIRALMKEKTALGASQVTGLSASATTSSSTSFESLSGKDKAKLLKILKEKEKLKQEGASSVANHGKSHLNNHLNLAQSTPTQTLRQPVSVAANIDSNAAPKPVKKVSIAEVVASKQQPNSFISHPSVSSTSGNSSNTGNRNIPSGLPEGFFDDYSATQSSELTTSTPLELSVTVDGIPLTSSSSSSSSAAAAEASSSSSLVNKPAEAPSLLPEGFYDDAAMDMKARGIDPQKLAERKELQAEQDFQTLLQEVEELPNSYEEFQDELELQRLEREEEALQLAYMTRVAVLMHATERGHANANPLDSTEQTQELSSVVSEAKELIASATIRHADGNYDFESQNGMGAGEMSIIGEVLKQQREDEKKRKRELEEAEQEALLAAEENELSLEDYYASYADNIDWTARSF